MVFLFAFIKILLYTNYGGFMKKVIYLNSNNVNISTGSSTNTFDNNGVNWLV